MADLQPTIFIWVREVYVPCFISILLYGYESLSLYGTPKCLVNGLTWVLVDDLEAPPFFEPAICHEFVVCRVFPQPVRKYGLPRPLSGILLSRRPLPVLARPVRRTQSVTGRGSLLV